MPRHCCRHRNHTVYSPSERHRRTAVARSPLATEGGSMAAAPSSSRRALLVAVPLAIMSAGLVLAPPVVLSSAEAGAAPVCSPAGATGFNAALVVTSSATVIPSSVDGTGCDLGIYVEPGANSVTINGVTVSGANDHGIMAEGVSQLTIENSTIQANGVNPNNSLGTDKAVQLVGVSNSTVGPNNTVTGNVADGGISVTDEGDNFDPPRQTARQPRCPRPTTRSPATLCRPTTGAVGSSSRDGCPAPE